MPVGLKRPLLDSLVNVFRTTPALFHVYNLPRSNALLISIIQKTLSRIFVQLTLMT